MLVTVVVCTLNRDEVLCNTLTSLFEQTYTPVEILVVDQTRQHNPATEEFLKTHSAQLQLIKVPATGLPNARNAGIMASHGEIVLFCDDDVLLKPSWIDFHVENYGEAQVAAVGGRILEHGHAILPDEPNRAHINIWGRPLGNFSSVHRAEIKTVRGGNMSFRRHVLGQVGCFDPNYIGTAILEETDLCYRILHAGHKIVYEPRAELLHFPQPSGNAANRQQSRRQWYHDYFHNGTLFLLKNRPWWVMMPFIAAQFLIAIRQGIIREKSVGAAAYMLSGIGKGMGTFYRNRLNFKRSSALAQVTHHDR